MAGAVARRHRRRADESGTVSLELVLLVPVLVLLTLFVLWAGRGGRVGLTANLAAEEAATAAALCCGENESESDGPPEEQAEAKQKNKQRLKQREAVARDVLESRPGLGFLCIGGPRPSPRDDPGDPPREGDHTFVRDEWVHFIGDNAFTGGVGVVEVGFDCETDGAVAPLRGLFPTVSFEGQAIEVVTKRPRSDSPEVWIEGPRDAVKEGEEMVFVVKITEPVEQDTTVTYRIVPHPDTHPSPVIPRTTATRGTDFDLPDGYDPDQDHGGEGTVTIPAGADKATISISTIDDKHPSDGGDFAFEADANGDQEKIVLQLTDVTHDDVQFALGPDDRATGKIEESTPQPHVWLECPPEKVVERDPLKFTVRLRGAPGSPDEMVPAPAADPVSVVVSLDQAGSLAEGRPSSDDSGADFVWTGDLTLSVEVGDTEASFDVVTVDDFEAESEYETVTLEIRDGRARHWPAYFGPAQLGGTCPARILDDEAEVTVVGALEADPKPSAVEGEDLIFKLRLRPRHSNRLPETDVEVEYELQPARRSVPATIGDSCGAPSDADGPDVAVARWPDPDSPDGFTSRGTVTFPKPSEASQDDLTQTVTVGTCDDPLTEPAEQVWLEVKVAEGHEAVVPPSPDPYGAFGTIVDNDTVRLVVDRPTATERDGEITFNVSLRLGSRTPLLRTGVGAKADPITVKVTTRDVASGDPAAHPATGTDACIAGAHGADYVRLPTTTLEFHGEILDDPDTDDDESEDAVTELPVTVVVCDDEVDGEPEEVFELVFTNPSRRADLFDGDPDQPDPTELTARGAITNVDANALIVDNPTAKEGQPLTFTVELVRPREDARVTVKYAVEDRTAQSYDPHRPDREVDWGQWPDPYSDVVDSQTVDAAGNRTRRTVSGHSGELVLTERNTRATVTVPTLINGKNPENNETVHLVLSDPSPGTVLAKAIGIGTITDVEPATVRVSMPRVEEGGELGFEISLVELGGDPYTDDAGNLRIGGPVQVNWSTEDLPPTESRQRFRAVGGDRCRSGSGTDNPDYVSRESGSHTFRQGGEPTATVSVTTCRDTRNEKDEQLRLVLSLDPANAYATLGDPIGTGTIVDLPPPALHIENAEADEGDPLQFKVRLGHWRDSGPSGRFDEAATNETVTFTVAPASGGSATPGEDFVGQFGQAETVTLDPGETSYTYTVATLADDEPELPETLFVNISSARNADIHKPGATGTINPKCNPLDGSEPLPDIELSEVRGIEGHILAMLVPVRFSAPVCDQFGLFTRRSAGRTGTPATCFYLGRNVPFVGDLACYEAHTLFDADDSWSALTQRLTLQLSTHVIDDDLDEHDETVLFEVRWAAAPDTPENWEEIEAVIVDDDPMPVISIAEADAREGTDLEFEWSLDTASGRDTAFEYRTVDGGGDHGATDPGDYAGTTADWTRVEVAEGTAEGRIVVATVADGDFDEDDETMRVELRVVDDSVVDDSNGRIPDGWLRIGDGIAVGTILAADRPALRIADAAATEGDDSHLEFVVTLDRAADAEVTVDYTTVQRTPGAGAATQGRVVDDPDADPGAEEVIEPEAADYIAAAGTLRFEPGQTEQTVKVRVIDDGEDEVPETLFVELSNAVGASLADPSALGTIDGELSCTRTSAAGDPDNSFELRPAAFDEDAGRVTFVLRLDKRTCHRLNVDIVGLPSAGYRPVAAPVPSDTATPGVDYELVAQPRFFAELTSEYSFDVVIADDDIDEADETILLGISAICPDQRYPSCPKPLNYDDSPAYGSPTGTIADNDAVSVSVESAGSVEEGGSVNFVVRADRPSSSAVSVDWRVDPIDSGHPCDGTTGGPDGSLTAAIPGADYRAPSGRAVIQPGAVTTVVRIPTIEDALHELDEVFPLCLSSPIIGSRVVPGALDTDCTDGACNVAVGRITDDDPAPSIRISNALAPEGETLAFVVALSAVSGAEAAVSISTHDGSGDDGATAPADYTALPDGATLTFAPGQRTKTVSIAARDDDDIEQTEKFFVHLTDPANVVRDKWIGTGTILDVSDRRVSIADAFAEEGGDMVFTLSFPGTPRGKDITIDYTTEADSATVGADYDHAWEDGAGAAGTARILAGQNSARIRIPTSQDALDEHDERFWVQLADPDGAELADPRASGVIRDDDPVPAVSVGDTEAVENGDGTPAKFKVTLSEPSGRDVRLAYSTADGRSDNDDDGATAGDDYTAAPSGSPVTIAAGDTEATVDVALIDDDDEEPVEMFRLVLEALALPDRTYATLDDTTGVARIIDDDGGPVALVSDPDPVYEASGASVSFTVRLSVPAGAAASVDYATEAGAATAGADYTGVSGTLSFAVGEQTKTVTVELVDDDVAEETETFRLQLSNASNLSIGDGTATATILDDDDLPAVSIADARAVEGDAASFAVSLTRASAQPVTVGWAAAADPTASDRAAAPDQDFAAASGTLTIPARHRVATVDVATLRDAFDEHDERFWVQLTGTPTGATLGTATAIGVIVDDNPLPSLSVTGDSQPEGDSLTFTVRLGAVSGRTVTVPWATEAVGNAAGHATPGDDYESDSGTLTFPPGTTARTVTVRSVQDEVTEPDEIFEVQLGEPSFAAAAPGAAAAVGAISDDDGLPRLSVAGIDVLEDDSPAIFTVELSRVSAQPISVDYATRAGSATAGSVDYGPRSGEARGTLEIAAGLSAGEISVFVVDDTIGEDTETFDLILSNPANAVIAEGADEATARILDNERARITAHGVNANEADGTVEVLVTLSHTTDAAVTVDYATFDGAATQPGDYVAVSGTLRIEAGETQATIAVALTDDIFSERPETFIVRLSNVSAGAALAGDEAAVAIYDDDLLPVIKPDQAYEFEEDAGTVAMRVVLSKASDSEIRVDYEFTYPNPLACDPVVDVSPGSGGTLVFPPGALTADIEVTLIDDDELCAVANTVDWERRNFSVLLSNPVGALLTTDPGYSAPSHIPDAWPDEFTSSFQPYRDTGPGQQYRRTLLFLVEVYEGGALPCIIVDDGNGVLESAGSARFRLRLNRAATSAVTATWRTRDPWLLFGGGSHRPSHWDFPPGTFATAGADYRQVSEGTVTVAAGDTEAWVEVPIIDDDEVEQQNEGLAVWVESSVNTISQSPDRGGRCEQRWFGSPVAWIIDDDTLPSLAVSDVEVSEDAAGSARFEVVLSRVSASDVTVRYATADGTAKQPADYTRSSGTLTIRAGQAKGFVEVPVIDDDEAEPAEQFTLQISDASGATIAREEGTATIIRDDLPLLSIADVEDYEHNVFICAPLTLSGGRYAGTVTVWVEAVAVPTLGAEAATPQPHSAGHDPSADYFPRGRRLLDLGVEGRVCVYLNHADETPEHDERFLIVLTDPVNAVLGKSQAWVTILDNDQPKASVADVKVAEGASEAVFTVELHAPGIHDASVEYTTEVRSSPGHEAAVPGRDYTTTSGLLEFPAGITSRTVSVPIVGDRADEPDESFLFVLSSPKAMTLADPVAAATITDDDPGWWVVDPAVVREAAGGATASVKVHRDHTGDSDFTLRYEVGATAGSATGGTACGAGVDFVIPPGSVVVPASATQAAIDITICDDDVDEGRETLSLSLTNVDGRDLSAVVTIADKTG